MPVLTIPTSFKLVNRNYSVEPMDQDTHDVASAKGAHNHSAGRILMYLDGDYPQEDIEHTFLHELFHAILDNMGYSDLSGNEDLVDCLGAAMHQYMQTKKGNLLKKERTASQEE